MNSVKEIEKAVSELSESDLISFREWFENFTNDAWDEQFEKDVTSGKLDALANQAITDFEAGKCKPI